MKFRQTTVLFISLRYTKIVFLRNTRRDEIERPQTISSRTLRTNEGLYIYIYIYLSIYLSVSIYLSIYLSIYIYFLFQIRPRLFGSKEGLVGEGRLALWDKLQTTTPHNSRHTTAHGRTTRSEHRPPHKTVYLIFLLVTVTHELTILLLFQQQPHQR